MKKIVIIDDDKVVRGIYQGRFQSEGFQVFTAADGETGLRLILDSKPDLVLLDLGLPMISGVEVITRLRAAAATAALPILVISNSYQPKLIQDAWKAGANRCLKKVDSTPKAVSEAVHQLLESAAKTTSATNSGNTPAGGSEAPGSLATSPELSTSYLVELAQTSLLELRQTLGAVCKSPTPARCRAELVELHASARNLTGCTAMNGQRSTAQLSNVLEALVEDLISSPSDITSSTLRTMAQVVDVLATTLKESTNPFSELTTLPPNILVVDDDTISRQMVCYALEKAGLNCISLSSATTALEVLHQNCFDLICLDAIMPDHTGYEICKRIRQTPEHEHTPIIFVTGQSEFQDRALSTLSGGTDLIGKPFLTVELAAKALVHLYTHRLKMSQARKAA
jgi:DNA-binding response OmpR family regulator